MCLRPQPCLCGVSLSKCHSRDLTGGIGESSYWGVFSELSALKDTLLCQMYIYFLFCFVSSQGLTMQLRLPGVCSVDQAGPQIYRDPLAS